jgi:hypothetical protein
MFTICLGQTGSVAGVAGEGFVEGVKKDECEDPEDDLGGNAFLFDDFFVEVLFAHVGDTPLLMGWMQAGPSSQK